MTRPDTEPIEKRRAKLEAQVAELTRSFAESYDGYAFAGPYVMKWARQQGSVRRELRELEEKVN